MEFIIPVTFKLQVFFLFILILTSVIIFMMSEKVNHKVISKLLLDFDELESEILTLLEFDYSSSQSEVYSTFVDNVIMRIKDRISNITNGFIQLYRSNIGCNFKINLNGQENAFSGDLLVLTLYNSLIFKLVLKIINFKTLDMNTKMLLLNRLIYDKESISKKLDTVSSILSAKIINEQNNNQEESQEELIKETIEEVEE